MCDTAEVIKDGIEETVNVGTKEYQEWLQKSKENKTN